MLQMLCCDRSCFYEWIVDKLSQSAVRLTVRLCMALNHFLQDLHSRFKFVTCSPNPGLSNARFHHVHKMRRTKRTQWNRRVSRSGTIHLFWEKNIFIAKRQNFLSRLSVDVKTFLWITLQRFKFVISSPRPMLYNIRWIMSIWRVKQKERNQIGK